MKLSIIIVSYNTKELLENCLNSIKVSLQSKKDKKPQNRQSETENLSLSDTEIIIVDNNSTDGSQKYLTKLKAQSAKRQRSKVQIPNIKIILNKENAGFSKANNQGIEKAKGKYILLLNSDTIITKKNFFTEAINLLAENKEVGIIGPKLLWENGQAQPSGGYFPTLPRLFTWALMIDDLPIVNKLIKPYHPHAPSFYTKDKYYQKTHEQDWVTGACFFIKRAVINKIGLLDENIFMYTEEMEYCYRAKKAGFKIVYYPKIFLVHLGGKSGTSLLTAKNEFLGIKYFYQKHQPLWQKPIANFLLKTAAAIRKFVFHRDQEKSQVYQQVLANL